MIDGGFTMQFTVQGKAIDFEELGYETRLRCRDRASAEATCGLKIHAYEDEVLAKNAAQEKDLQKLERHAEALHSHLYGRPDPVNDAEMLARTRKIQIYLGIAALTSVDALAGNAVTFALYGYGLALTGLLAVCVTAFLAAVGHAAGVEP
jgi:hypothetical protein